MFMNDIYTGTNSFAIYINMYTQIEGGLLYLYSNCSKKRDKDLQSSTTVLIPPIHHTSQHLNCLKRFQQRLSEEEFNNYD